MLQTCLWAPRHRTQVFAFTIARVKIGNDIARNGKLDLGQTEIA